MGTQGDPQRRASCAAVTAHGRLGAAQSGGVLQGAVASGRSAQRGGVLQGAVASGCSAQRGRALRGAPMLFPRRSWGWLLVARQPRSAHAGPAGLGAGAAAPLARWVAGRERRMPVAIPGRGRRGGCVWLENCPSELNGPVSDRGVHVCPDRCAAVGGGAAEGGRAPGVGGRAGAGRVCGGASCARCSLRAAKGGARACRSSVCPGPPGAIAFGLSASKWGPFRLGVHGSLC